MANLTNRMTTGADMSVGATAGTADGAARHLSPLAVSRTIAAILIGSSPRSLARYAIEGGGPPFVRIGRGRLVYEVAALTEWLRARSVASTSAEAEARRAPNSRRKQRRGAAK